MTVRVVTFDDNVSSTVSPTDANLTRTVMVNGTDVTDPNFIDSSTVTFIVSGSNISLTSSGGGGTGGGHVIENAAGDDLAQRANLQFVGATVSDDAANDRTIVEVTQGERIVIGEDQFKVETASGMTFDPPRTEAGMVGDATEIFTAGAGNVFDLSSKYLTSVSSGQFTIYNHTTGAIASNFSLGTNAQGVFLDNEEMYYSSAGSLFKRTVGATSSTTEFTDSSLFPLGVCRIDNTTYFTTSTEIRQQTSATTSTLLFTPTGGITFGNLKTDGTRLYYQGTGNSLRSINVTGTIVETIHTAAGVIQGISLNNGLVNGISGTNTLVSYNISLDTLITNDTPSNITINSNGGYAYLSVEDSFISTIIFSSFTFVTFNGLLSYTQTLALPNVTINTDTDKYVYTAPTLSIGPLIVDVDPTVFGGTGTAGIGILNGDEFIILFATDTNVSNVVVGSILTLKTGVTATVTVIAPVNNGVNTILLITYNTGSRASFTDGESIDIEFPNIPQNTVINTQTATFFNAAGVTTAPFISTNGDTNPTTNFQIRLDIPALASVSNIPSTSFIQFGTDTIVRIISGSIAAISGFQSVQADIVERGTFDFSTTQSSVSITFISSLALDVGTLEIIDEEHYDMNFSLNITNSASYTGTDYQLFLDIDGLNSGTIVNELVSGTTTYNVTVPASIHRGNDIRIREFVPDATTINAITTSWSAGSSWAVDEAAISGLQTSKVTLAPTTPSASQSVTHNLNNNYLTVWVVYNGRTMPPRQQVINTFTIASNDTIDVTGLATDADIASYTFLIQGF